MISPKLQRDLDREAAYYADPNNDGNIRFLHMYKQTPGAKYYVDYHGKNVYVYKKGKWSIRKIYLYQCPAMKKLGCHAYRRVMMGKYMYILLHRVIADVFIPNTDFTLCEIDHIDGNYLNNNALNLERVTHEENIRRRYYNYYTRQGRPVPAKFLPVC